MLAFKKTSADCPTMIFIAIHSESKLTESGFSPITRIVTLPVASPVLSTMEEIEICSGFRILEFFYDYFTSLQ